MGEEVNKKIIASFELTLLILSFFAFSYIFQDTNNAFYTSKNKNKSLFSNIKLITKIIIEKLQKPIIPMVSAAQSSLGCCELATDGSVCSSQSSDTCESGFNEGLLCEYYPQCLPGCCFDEEFGDYAAGVYKFECSDKFSWTDDANCNYVDAYYGCCDLGDINVYETRKKCEVLSAYRAVSPIMWDSTTTEGSCIASSIISDDPGACIDNSGACTMTSEPQCSGDFYIWTLCTSPSLETECEMTTNTMKVEGKDGVYFQDSCGQPGNIYDSNKITSSGVISDPSYWDLIISKEDSCGSSFINGNANSGDCGNCDKFNGGLAASASENNFDVEYGDLYCKETSCIDAEGIGRNNAESWCIYESSIGNGDDTVGSRHYKYSCSYGEIIIDPCADYRNEICIQDVVLDSTGAISDTKAMCIPNNWQTCISYNSEDHEDDGMDLCKENPQCQVEDVNFTSDFYFNACVPKYPGGFDLTSLQQRTIMDDVCGAATITCQVVLERNIFNPNVCDVVANAECMGEEFAKKANNFCRKIGDCGGESNYVGEYVPNYELSGEYLPRQSKVGELHKKGYYTNIAGSAYTDSLKLLAIPVDNQYAEFSDYESFFENLNIAAFGTGDIDNVFYTNSQLGMYIGFGGLAVTTWAFAGAPTSIAAISGIGATGGVLASSSGILMGAAVGAILGYMAASELGLEPQNAMLLTIAGAAAGAALMGVLMGSAAIGTANAWNPIGWVLLAITTLIAITAGLTGLLSGECLDYEVTYECKPWVAPVDVDEDDCAKCNDESVNGDCNKYKCDSLGVACEYIDIGDGESKCILSEDDDYAPVITQADEYIKNIQYVTTPKGLSVRAEDGGCLDAGVDVGFGVETDKHAYCKYSIETTPEALQFENMKDFGLNGYNQQHWEFYRTVDPSFGESRGADWNDTTVYYIQCIDAHKNYNPEYFEIDVCVKQGDDLYSTRIGKIVPSSGSLVGFETSNVSITVYTNEHAECRFTNDSTLKYFEMENNMTCAPNFGIPNKAYKTPWGYPCNATIQTPNAENKYYINCMDQPWLEDEGRGGERNSMDRSQEYKLMKPLEKIKIDYIEPYNDFKSPTSLTPIDLKIKTSGGGKYSYCEYSLSGYDNMGGDVILGRNKVHERKLNIMSAKQTVYVECYDETGDRTRGESTFTIIHDNSPPGVSRVWQESGQLHITTNEYSTCKYSTKSCAFDWESGSPMNGNIEHTASVNKGDTYYVRCADEFKNGKSSSTCAIQVMAI